MFVGLNHMQSKKKLQTGAVGRTAGKQSAVGLGPSREIGATVVCAGPGRREGLQAAVKAAAVHISAFSQVAVGWMQVRSFGRGRKVRKANLNFSGEAPPKAVQ